jgi:hypothetical protein
MLPRAPNQKILFWIFAVMWCYLGQDIYSVQIGQNFEVTIQTEFQFEIRRWLVTSTLSYVALQTASWSKFPLETQGWKERSRDDIDRGNTSANRGGMESGNGQTPWCHTDERAGIQHGSSGQLHAPAALAPRKELPVHII